jgi:hypothetical protein
MIEQLGTPVAIFIKRRHWGEMGLEAHGVYLMSEHVQAETGKVFQIADLLDSHFQETTAWQCAERWASRYQVPVKAYVNLRKALIDEQQ